MSWKGLLLAGGTGSRLYPLTGGTNKHVLPVFDKPMIYYPLSTLMLADVRDIVVVSSPSGIKQIRALLGTGHQFGLRLSYVEQPRPGGVAEGLIVAEEQLTGHDVAMILGDNIFFGSGLERILAAAKTNNRGATIFGYDIANPSAYGIVTLRGGKPVDLVEKPRNSRSRMAVTGLYLYDKGILDIARNLKPSTRGELEITDVNRTYLRQGQLDLRGLGRGTEWLDAGTPDDLFAASQFVQIFQIRTGLKIAAPEEIAYRRGFIGRNDLSLVISKMLASEYRSYLKKILDEDDVQSDDTTAKK